MPAYMPLSDAIALLLANTEPMGDSYLIPIDDMQRLSGAPELASAADTRPLYRAAADVWRGARLIPDPRMQGAADCYAISAELRQRLYIASMRDALGLE